MVSGNCKAPLAGKNSKPFYCKKFKEWRIFQNNGFLTKAFEEIRCKNANVFHCKTNQGIHEGLQNRKQTKFLYTEGNKTVLRLSWKNQIETVGIFARSKLWSQFLHVYFLCGLRWSCNGHWHSQAYHVRVQARISIFTENKHKKELPKRNFI